MVDTVNLTPHEVRVVGRSRGEIVYPPFKGGPARAVAAAEGNYPVGWTEEGAVVYMAPRYTGIAGLPVPEAKVRAIIVSTIVAELLAKPEFAHLYRGTVLVPDSNPASAIRDDKGHIVAVQGLLWYTGPPAYSAKADACTLLASGTDDYHKLAHGDGAEHTPATRSTSRWPAWMQRVRAWFSRRRGADSRSA